MSNDLPRGWTTTTLGAIAEDISYGFTAPSTREPLGPRLLRITDIQNNNVGWHQVPYCEIDEGLKPKYLLKDGDLVFARTGATVGKSFLIKGEVPDAVFASYLIRVRCATRPIPNFLIHYFQSPDYWSQITEFSAGIGQPNVNGSKLKALSIPLPPLTEQKRIAQKLDALLAQVDTLKARIDAIPALLKRFRQSVLSDLTRGPSPDDADDRWNGVPVGEICVQAFDGPFGSKLKSDDYVSSGVRVVRLENIGHLEFMGEKITYVSADKGSELSKNALKEGDILFSSFVDEEVRVCRLPKSEESFINKADCFCLRVDPAVANSRFVTFALASRSTFVRIRQAVHGATRPRINLGFLKAFEIRLPTLEEQTEIVRRVEQLFAFADQFEAKVAIAKQRIDTLTQSILAKAFRGELVPQDPNDEPASVLLERIRAQRAATPKPRRGRKAAADHPET